jgi:hypothetical protein
MQRRTSRKPKRITHQQVTGQQGANFVEGIVLEMGFLWHPTNAALDAGIDGIIEIRDPVTGDAMNNIVQVQVKATEQEWISADTSTEFSYLCKERDIDYWMKGNTPVVLIVVRPRGDEAYWANVKEVFADPKRRRDGHIRFDKKTQRFDASAASALVKLAVSRDWGPYMPAIPYAETLISNLLEVTSFPPTMYVASTDYRDPQEIFDWARTRDLNLPNGWLLSEQSIRSVYDLREQPWVELVHRGSVETFDMGEWADADDPDKRREFVRLMNQALREDMDQQGLRWSSGENCFYFPAKRDAGHNPVCRQYDYKSLEQNTSREVVQIHRHPDTNEIIYCRHNALRCAFLRVERQWCLALTPHYVYTTDGKTPYPRGEDLLSGMKRMEHQAAVLGQVVMWKYKLTHVRSKGLFDERDVRPLLISFGELLKESCDRGIDERSWLSTDAPISDDESGDDWGLFDA